jgi:hypothetical protein
VHARSLTRAVALRLLWQATGNGERGTRRARSSHKHQAHPSNQRPQEPLFFFLFLKFTSRRDSSASRFDLSGSLQYRYNDLVRDSNNFTSAAVADSCRHHRPGLPDRLFPLLTSRRGTRAMRRAIAFQLASREQAQAAIRASARPWPAVPVRISPRRIHTCSGVRKNP